MNWKKRIKKAKKTGSFTEEDKEMSKSFHTCAIGEVFSRSKKYRRMDVEAYLEDRYGVKKGHKLYTLGMNFFYLVTSQSIRGAETVYKKIQKLKVV